ncbi:hypothetical protein quinque_010454 [Culex quinquefasciatus]
MNPPQPGQSSAPPLGLGLRNNMQPLGSCPPPPPSMLQMQQQYHPLAYRNELYDRTAGYDVPRGGGAVPRNNYYQNQQSFGSAPRYQNLHLDLNRPRCAPNSMRTPRQRSFDDTESYQYYRYQNQNNFAKHDNVYERVREEPAYQNTGSFGTGAGPSNRGLFGRLDVIGHGLSRLREHEYENVPVDSPSGRVDYAGGRPTLTNTNRARSESPSHSSSRREDRAGASDPFRNWAFNFEDNSFRPAAGGLPNGIPRPREIRRITDGTFRSVDYQHDNERPGPSREFSRDSPKPTPTIVVNDSGTASTSRSNSASPPKSKESSVSPVQHEKEEVPVSSSSDSENYVMDSIATDGGGPAEESSSSCCGPFVEVAEHAAGGDKDCGKDKEPTSSMETSESSNFEENAAESLASDDDNDNDENIEAI